LRSSIDHSVLAAASRILEATWVRGNRFLVSGFEVRDPLDPSTLNLARSMDQDIAREFAGYGVTECIRKTP